MKPTQIRVDDEMIKAARRVLPVFQSERLRAMRELHGWAQTAVADTVGITASALSQAEKGGTTPSAANVARLAAAYGVPSSAFAERPASRVSMQPQFRHLRRTSKREQRRAVQLVSATVQLAETLRSDVQFPEPFELPIPIDPDAAIDLVADEVEEAAAAARHALNVPPLTPLGSDLIGVLEAGGVTVVRDPETDKDIDAYSAIVDGLPIIVLDGRHGSVWDRDNFNLAHELGHLVMHQGIDHQPGTRTVEAQAHRFAGAFLGPAAALRAELPVDLDWQSYLNLKRRWGVSMAALVRRAKDLGVIDEPMYTRAMKQRSSFGWRTVEPGSDDRPLPAPTYLARASTLVDLDTATLAIRSNLPAAVVERIVGQKRPSLLD